MNTEHFSTSRRGTVLGQIFDAFTQTPTNLDPFNIGSGQSAVRLFVVTNPSQGKPPTVTPQVSMEVTYSTWDGDGWLFIETTPASTRFPLVGEVYPVKENGQEFLKDFFSHGWLVARIDP